jgi:FkbM family methyltransferase
VTTQKIKIDNARNHLMLNIKNENLLHRKIKSFCLKVFNYLDNNGNCDFDTNGEAKFIKNFVSTLKKKEPVIFDVGSNVGLYVQKILEYTTIINCNPQIHVFEPTNSCYNILQQKFISYQNIKLNNFGVSDSETGATIYYDSKSSGLASLYQRNLKHYQIDFSEKEIIQLRRLDRYIKECNISHIDFLKIDIEGHELAAFNGLGDYLNATFIDAIQFEYGGCNLDSHTSLMEIFDILTNSGFKMYKVMPTHLEPREYRASMENFQYANYVALSPSLDKI